MTIFLNTTREQRAEFRAFLHEYIALADRIQREHREFNMRDWCGCMAGHWAFEEAADCEVLAQYKTNLSGLYGNPRSALYDALWGGRRAFESPSLTADLRRAAFSPQDSSRLFVSFYADAKYLSPEESLLKQSRAATFLLYRLDVLDEAEDQVIAPRAKRRDHSAITLCT